MNTLPFNEFTTCQFSSSIGCVDGSLKALFEARPPLEIIYAGTTIKQDEHRRTVVFEMPTRKVFAKMYLENDPRERLRSRLLGSRGRSSFATSRQMAKYGTSTPKTLGFIEFSVDGLKGSASFTEFLRDGVTLWNILHDDKPDQDKWVNTAFRQLAELHRAGLIHGDVKLNNLMVQGDKLYYVDTDSARVSKLARFRTKDVARLLVGFSEAQTPPELTKQALSEYFQVLGLKQEKNLPAVIRTAQKIQRRHHQEYNRPPRPLL